MYYRLIASAVLVSALVTPSLAREAPRQSAPRTITELLHQYPDATLKSEGVYEVKRGDRRRTFMFGAAGAKHYVDYLSSMHKRAVRSGADKASLANMQAGISLATKGYRAKLARSTSLTKASTEFYDWQVCGTYIDVINAYNNGFTAADAYAYVGADPDGFSPAYSGTVILAASAYKFDDFYLYQYDTPTPVVAAGYIDAGVSDTFGTPQTCTLGATGQVIFEDDPECSPEPWYDEGPCV